MITFNLTNLSNFSENELAAIVTNLAISIQENKDFAINNFTLMVLNQPRNTLPSLEVMNSFTAITKEAIEKGMYENLKEQLKTISNLNQQIITANPITSSIAQDLCPEALCIIMSEFTLKEAKSYSPVSTSWKAINDYKQIDAINKGLKLKVAFKGLSAKEVVKRLIDNNYCESLDCADFLEFPDFNNKCLEDLTKNCPNLKHLFIKSYWVERDALKYLINTKDLQSLSIRCENLESDALKHLKKTPHLKNLTISCCPKLEPDCLKHLDKIQGLESLEISGSRFEADALRHLVNTKKLLNLSILGSFSLKNLSYTKNLQYLSISYCEDPKALEQLTHTPDLQSLTISKCSFERDALKNLKSTPRLKSLYIADCQTLEPDVLKNLEHIKDLQNLTLHYCWFEKDALKHLEKTPQLKNLNIFICRSLDRSYLPDPTKVTIQDPYRHLADG